MQPLHSYPDSNTLDVWARNIGPTALLGLGLEKYCGGGRTPGLRSDWPVVTLNPWEGVQTGVTRQTTEGQPEAGFVPAQRLTVAQVVEGYTLAAAFAGRREKTEGSLEVGKLADLIILSQNISTLIRTRLPSRKLSPRLWAGGSSTRRTQSDPEEQMMTKGNFHKWKSVFFSMVVLFGVAPLESGGPERTYDIVITNGHIIDGTARRGTRATSAFATERLSPSAISATRGVHTPLTLAAKSLLPASSTCSDSRSTPSSSNPVCLEDLPGITTEVTGEGESIAPLNGAIVRADQEQFDHYRIQVDWRTFREYFSRLEKQHIGINIASYVGATRVRRMVLGDDDVQPTPAQLEQMQELVRQTMRDGVVGVSTSLEYAPRLRQD